MTRVTLDVDYPDLRSSSRRLPATQIQQQRNDRVVSGSRRRPLSVRIPSQDVGMRSSSDATLVSRCHPNDPPQSSLAPRASALLRAVQRGDYRGLAKLLESPNTSPPGYANEQEQDVEDAGVLGALLTEACGREHLDCIELLLQHTRRPKRSLKRQGYFPMHTAAGTGAIESMELLISAGLSPRSRDDGGRTPLHHAAAHGSAECVSFLCAFARNTTRAGDRRIGDTPLHFAVRASHAVCIQVLLAHAGTELVHEVNAKGETPLDVARALCGGGDCDTACLRALEDGATIRRTTIGPRVRRGVHSGLESGVDLQRIMAVWERFFENAAMRACVEQDLATLSVEEYDNDEPRHSGSPPEIQAIVEGLGGQGNVYVDDDGQAGSAGRTEGQGRVIETASEGGCDGVWGTRGNDYGRYEDCVERFGAFHLPDTCEVAPMRVRAWEEEVEPLADHGRDSSQGADHSIHAPTTTTQVGEPTFFKGVVRNETSSTDDGPSLNQTPRSGTGRWARSSYTVKAEIDTYSEQHEEVSTAASASLDQAWVACWDAASEAVYYWNSAGGELNWNAPPAGSAAVSSRIWDSEREAFFAVDESGESHWLSAGADVFAATSTDYAAVNGNRARGAATAAAVDGDGLTPQVWSSPSFPQGLGIYSLNEDDDNGNDDVFHPAVAEEGRWFDGESTPGDSSCGIGHGDWGGSQATEAFYAATTKTFVEKLHQDREENASCFFDAQDERKHADGNSALFSVAADTGTRGVSCNGYTFDGSTVSDCCPPRTVEEGEETQPPLVHTGDVVEPTTVDAENTDTTEIKIDDDGGVHFFDANMYDTQEQPTNNRPPNAYVDGTVGGLNRKEKQEAEMSSVGKVEADEFPRLLPRWVMWCPRSPDAPSYFVNEETGDASWVLPPEVVVPSGGWLRAWSEEHEAYFYSNQWTAKVTWEMDDLLGVGG